MDGVVDVGGGISVDVDLVDSLLVGFIEALVRYFSVGAEYISHDIWYSACDNTCFFVDVWHHGGFVGDFR